jgi:transporter family-2 protein
VSTGGAGARLFGLALAGAAAGGALIGVQSRINGELSHRLGQSMEAALWSFGSGLALLTALLLVPALRRGMARVPAAVRSGELCWWECIGGLSGACLVAVQTYAVPLVGVALFTVAVVGGQTLSGLGVDRLGLGPAGRTDVTRARMLAALLAIVGVAVAVFGEHGTSTVALLPAVLAFLVGVSSAAQQAVNGKVNGVSRQPLSTTWLNFATGTVLLLVLTGIVALARSDGGGSGAGTPPWWSWLGGLCGIGFIALAAWAVRHTGVLLFGLVTLSGQLLTALALDLASPRTRGQIGTQVVLGLAITLAAAAMASVAAGRRRSQAARRASA